MGLGPVRSLWLTLTFHPNTEKRHPLLQVNVGTREPRLWALDDCDMSNSFEPSNENHHDKPASPRDGKIDRSLSNGFQSSNKTIRQNNMSPLRENRPQPKQRPRALEQQPPSHKTTSPRGRRIDRNTSNSFQPSINNHYTSQQAAAAGELTAT